MFPNELLSTKRKTLIQFNFSLLDLEGIKENSLNK